MTLFKKKKNKEPALNFSLDQELRYARARKQTYFHYLLNEDEVSKAMAWGVKNRIAIKPDYIADGKIYYKFFGYSMEG